jgi:hypothetical protein
VRNPKEIEVVVVKRGEEQTQRTQDVYQMDEAAKQKE